MMKYKDFYQELLEEAYASLSNPPSEVQIATNSEAEKVLRGRKKSDLNTIQALENTLKNYQSIKIGPVWQVMTNPMFGKRFGDVNVKVSLKLKGRNHERAIGKIENGVYYVYWIGTHEEYNKIV